MTGQMRLTVQGTLPAGDIWITGFWCFPTPGMTEAAAVSNWATAWDLAWNGTGAADDLKSLIKTTVTADLLTATYVDNSGKNMTQAVQTIALAGTATDDCMPQETTPVWSLRTLNASKAGRGRCYLPPLTEASNMGDGLMSSTAQNHITAAGQNCIQSLNGNGMDVVVIHRGPWTGDDVVAVDTANLFRVQRRRQKSVAVTRVRASV